jgi:peptidoglycan/xylan/chitin deacetylase (PgdA/CDA1 family)
MNLIAFSMKTKGVRNFARRLWTVFTRFGISEKRTHKALYALIDLLHEYHAAPTFFIPAVVLQRHPALLRAISGDGAEIGIHGYVHNDYRSLTESQQYKQTEQAIAVFQANHIPYQGFRNPYLGWTEESLSVFTTLHMGYESNEAVIHDVIDPEQLSPLQRGGYEKSLSLFQAIEPSTYSLRPHFEGPLLRLPTSIPDDEMLFDRLRITDPREIGRIWSQVMQRVYDSGGVYILNLHPERGILCRQALSTLLYYASSRPQPIWFARLDEIAQWWKERSQFRLHVTPLAANRWQVEATCTPCATLFARHLVVEGQSSFANVVGATALPRPLTSTTANQEAIECPLQCIVQSEKCPCIGVSPRTSQAVQDFLHEQGYPFVASSLENADAFSFYLDMPEELGSTREEQQYRCSKLVEQIEQLEVPLLSFGCWPNGYRAALAISGDIDSVTIQDFFLRVIEVSSAKVPYVTVPRVFNKEKLA